MKRQSLLLLLMILMLAVRSGAADKVPEPTGFEKAKFGMSVAEVQKLYPEMHQAKQRKETGDPLVVYILDNQAVGPLKPCEVRLQFSKDELYEVRIRCNESDKVGEYLQKTFGKPTDTMSSGVYWMGEHGAVSLAPRTGMFSFSDLKRIQAVQGNVLTAVTTPPATPSPMAVTAVTPTPSAAPAATPHKP